MRKSYLAIVSAAAVSLGSAIAMAQTPTPTTPGKALSDSDCTAAWTKALGTSKATTLDESASKGFVADFKTVDTNADKKIDQTEWKAGCTKGLVLASATTGTAHPPTKQMDKMVPPMKAN